MVAGEATKWADASCSARRLDTPGSTIRSGVDRASCSPGRTDGHSHSVTLLSATPVPSPTCREDFLCKFRAKDAQRGHPGSSRCREPDRSRGPLQGLLSDGSRAGYRNGAIHRAVLESDRRTTPTLVVVLAISVAWFLSTKRTGRIPDDRERHPIHGSHRPIGQSSPRIGQQAGRAVLAAMAGDTQLSSPADSNGNKDLGLLLAARIPQRSKYPSPCRATSDGSSRAGAVRAAPGSPIVAAVSRV